MKDHLYKVIELTGTSTTSIEDTVNKAIKRVHKTLKNLSWFEMVETRGSIDKGQGATLAGEPENRLRLGRLSARFEMYRGWRFE